MVVRWQNSVFIRHVGDESLMWCPRTGGCTVLKDAEPILEEMGWSARDEMDIVGAVAGKFGCGVDEVKFDVAAVLGELEEQGFVIREGVHAAYPCEGLSCASLSAQDAERFEDYSPLGDFCYRHGMPVDLHVDLTDACTERCVHCYVPQEMRNFLAYELVEKALNEFRAMNGLTVHLTGGEAMLHPEFERICRLLVKLNLNFIVFSNLTVCEGDRIAFLKEVEPQFINVSLYSMNEKEHDDITCLRGSWRKTMRAILACEEAGVHVRIATPLLRENQSAFPALKKFADEHHMHLIPSCGITPRANHTCSNLDHACSASELETVLLQNKALFDRGWQGMMPRQEDCVCDIGLERLYLNAKGNYYPCDCMHEYVLGTVRENTLNEVWTGDKLNYLRGLKNGNFGACAMCESRPWCKVCPAFNFNATGDLFKSLPEKCAQASVIRKVYGKEG